ncbi:MAG TPA: tRNA lysidine(34) synthetase TilS [Candidatus Saccharimonadales bacterium]|nr:tRNA lysidine(34) synthetase TilS [Candidatus Saccharimonadales bacterium]
MAVSGGVDSIVLLDLLRRQPGLQLIVAHVNHGIRDGSAERDAEFVRQVAAKLELPFELHTAQLGPDASEETARVTRYNFLRLICKKYQATLVTAHHQDDLIETMIINLLRGTGWRGLTSLRSTASVRRPLLGRTKKEIIAYATTHQLRWFDDETNDDRTYLRNDVRHRLLPGMRAIDPKLDETLLAMHQDQLRLRAAIEVEVATILDLTQPYLSRYQLIMWPDEVALECLQTLIAAVCGRRLLTSQAQRALLFAKSGRVEAVMQPAGWAKLRTTATQLIVEPT